ncbi:MAG: response regulator [Pseudomonadota bacterium]
MLDDEEDIREVISIVLTDAGFSVTTAEDGETGLAFCETINPQIVITDIRMPGIDGIQVLRSVKQKYPDIEVIVITAFGEMELAVKALQLDASDFVIKPIDESALLVSIERAQQRYSSRQALKDYTRLLEKENAQTAQELIKTYSFQKNLIDSSMDGILACDENEVVVTFNRSMEAILGYEKSDVLHKISFFNLLAAGEDKKFRRSMACDTFGGKDRLSLYETVLMGKSNTEVPVQISATALWDNHVKTGLVCFVRDLRQIRRLERELSDQASILHQDKLMSLGRLSASVVHEINNPLFGVLNYVRLMIRLLEKDDLPTDSMEKFKRYLDLVEKEIQRCSAITSNLLKFSRKSEPSFGQVSLKELFNKCVLLCQHKLELSNIKLISLIHPDIPPIKGDSNQLQQCMINLIFNAMDAMQGGGTITQACEYDARASEVIISVTDTGSGIKKEDLPNIFEPFFTTKKGGYSVGLGLSTVFGIVEHHKGSIQVESQKGHTTFSIHLPMHQPPAPAL